MRLKLFAALSLMSAIACGDKATTEPDPATATFASALNVNISTMTATGSGLYYRDSIVGTGATAQRGNTITAHYTLWLTNGTQLETSVGKTPFTFPLGARAVIAGWDEGIVGMKVGGIRKLVVPPQLGYGSQVQGSIPSNSILVFNVQLVSVR
jgi:FKBP-type peptidyl-prolyl cis-trans isomerase FkpA